MEVGAAPKMLGRRAVAALLVLGAATIPLCNGFVPAWSKLPVERRGRHHLALRSPGDVGTRAAPAPPSLRMSSAPPTENKEKRLPEKVPGFFPLWEQNVMQTFFKTNPDDSIVADLPILAQARSPRPAKQTPQNPAIRCPWARPPP